MKYKIVWVLFFWKRKAMPSAEADWRGYRTGASLVSNLSFVFGVKVFGYIPSTCHCSIAHLKHHRMPYKPWPRRKVLFDRLLPVRYTEYSMVFWHHDSEACLEASSEFRVHWPLSWSGTLVFNLVTQADAIRLKCGVVVDLEPLLVIVPEVRDGGQEHRDAG